MSAVGAACSALVSLSADKSVFRILPAGLFKAVDGRPTGGSWLLTPQRAAELVTAAAMRSNDYVIDYEHQTIQSATNGQPAPAAGWFRQLGWRADGLYVLDARWTAQAKQMIESQQYRFISPVFAFSETTFEVLALQNVALTNDPALHGLTDLALLKSGIQESGSDRYATELSSQVSPRDLERLRNVFGKDILTQTADSMRAKAQQEAATLTSQDRQNLNANFGHFGLKF